MKVSSYLSLASVLVLASAAAPARAQTTVSSSSVRFVSAIQNQFAAVDEADELPFGADVFATPLVITTSQRGPFVITFSGTCDMNGGSGNGGKMLIHASVDGVQVDPGEIEVFFANPNEIREHACSYTWVAPDVPAGRHTVQANLRIFDGLGGGFARATTSTMVVLHDK